MNKKQQFDQIQFFNAIDLISKNNLIEKQEIFNIISETIIKTFHTKYDPDANLEVIIEPEKNQFKLINHSVLVVENESYDDKYSAIEISLSEAQKSNKGVAVGDYVKYEVSFEQFSTQIKQLLTQTLRERKKENVFAKHKSLVGEMVNGEVTVITKRGDVVLVLSDGTSAFMPSAMRNMKIDLSVGEHIKVYVEEVKKESRDSQIIVSNGSKQIIKRLLEIEVPEIRDGIIEVVSIARIAGERTKIAVKTNDLNVDPIGAVIGAGGKRIIQILSKLNGEKMDVILWSEDLNTFVANALEPAKVISVLDKVDNENRGLRNAKIVITPQIHQTLAIGKNGSNVRLAVDLTKTNIDIMSETQAQELGLNLVWNGTVNSEDLIKLEKGLRLSRNSNKNHQRINRNQKSQTNNFGIDLNEFNKDIRMFAEEITDEHQTEKTTELHDENLFSNAFSDEELRKMEAEFGLDLDNDELAFDNDELDYDTND